jgi:hypothetical protein
VHGDDLDALPGHDPNIDPSGVVAVDQHDVLEVTSEEVLVEAVQRKPILDFNHALNVRIDVENHLRRHVRRPLVDRLLGELESTGPVEAAVREDLYPGVLVLDVERPPIRA